MKLAYLVNQYPHVSHTFIRREIAAHEAAGLPVIRFSIRPAPSELVDPADIAEVSRTEVVLNAGWISLASALIASAFSKPLQFLRCLAVALRLGRKSNQRLRTLAYFVEACWLARDCARIGVTHIHAHFGTNPAAVALLCYLLGGPTYSFTVHGPEEFDQPIALSLRDKIENAAFVCAVSDYGRSQLFRWSPHSHWSKIQVVRCGVDAEFLHTPRAPITRAKHFVCVGRLCEQKGQFVLLEAMAELAKTDADVRVVMVGDGPLRQEFRDLIRTLNLQENVHITGWLNNSDVRAEIEGSRALVLPSFAEGLPVVIMEAMALGRPVISTFIAGIPELVRDGENGRLVPAGSVAALVAAMQSLLNDSPESLERMGSMGRADVAERHDAATEACRLRQLLSSRVESDQKAS